MKDSNKTPDIKQFTVSSNLIAHLVPTSPAAEAYRVLRTNIHYSSIDKKIKSIVITSPTIQDGKTVTASNLAISIANTGISVLLIDADLRKPNIHKQFRISNSKGLTDLLVGELTIDDAMKSIRDIPGLKVLTCGTIPPNPSELLSSKKIKDLIHEVSLKYDMVIIDTPPIGHVSDGIVLSSEADGVILTIAARKTKINHAQISVEALKKVNANILGVVMTKVRDKKKIGYYEYK